MRDPLSRDFSSLQWSQDSCLHRVRDNFHQLLTPAHIFPSSANGAPLHLLRFDSSPHASRAQGVSFLTHAAAIAALALIAMHTLKTTNSPENSATKVLEHLKFPSHFFPTSAVAASQTGRTDAGAADDI